MNFHKKNKKSKVFWGLVFIVTLGIFCNKILLSNSIQNNQRYYLQGLNFVSKRDYQNAYYNFSVVKKGNAYYCPAKYRAGLAAQKLYDKDATYLKFKEVNTNCQNTIFEEPSKYELAKMEFERGEYKRAKALFSILLKEAQTEKYQIASNYFLGKIEETAHPINAKTDYLKYLEFAPNGKYAKDTLESLKKLNQIYNPDEAYVLAKALYANNQYKEARDKFSLLPFTTSWYYLAQIEKSLGNNKKAFEIIDKGLKTNTSNLEDDNIQSIIDIYAELYGSKKDGYNMVANILSPKKQPGGDYALYKTLAYLNEKEKLPTYYRIYNDYPNGKFASNALWNIIYSKYKQKRYTEVVKLAEIHDREYANTKASPQVLFFTAKSLKNLGKHTQSKNHFNKILSKYPESYYALRATLLLNGRKHAWTLKNKKQIITSDLSIPLPLNYCNLKTNDIETMKLLEKIGDHNLIEELLGDNKIVQSWVHYKKGNKTISSVLARNYIEEMKTKPTLNDNIYKLAYPIYYKDTINKYAKSYNLDAYILLSIIKEESHFDTNIKSYVGAIGLMQLMPDTASFIATSYNLPYNSKNLTEVDTNIMLGSAYLDYALNLLSKKYLYAIAGYNGGHNAVKNWHSTLNYEDMDEFVEEIPYAETQNYIYKVFKSYWNYLNIYDTIN